MSEKTIVLAGGCFWGMEALYRSLPGVMDAVPGYANGKDAKYAEYQMVCTGLTEFREAIQVTYDPEIISLKKLLFCLFCVIDPTMYHRQGMDIGSQYQSGIYWTDPADEETVRAVAKIESEGRRGFCTELEPLKLFCPAEEYHQRYLDKNPGGYCHISPMKRAALLKYPYSDETYTTHAEDLLDAFRASEG